MSIKKDRSSEEAYNKPPSPLQPVWNGLVNEHYGYRNKLLGVLLTFAESMIVDQRQLKSMQTMIKKFIWEDEACEFNMAKWFKWFEKQYHFQGQDNDAKIPMKYSGIPAGDFREYK